MIRNQSTKQTNLIFLYYGITQPRFFSLFLFSLFKVSMISLCFQQVTVPEKKKNLRILPFFFSLLFFVYCLSARKAHAWRNIINHVKSEQKTGKSVFLIQTRQGVIFSKNFFFFFQKLWFQHVWPCLQQEMKTQEVLAAVLQPIIFLVQECTLEEYESLILPSFR